MEVISVGGLEIRPDEFVATVDGRRLDLTQRELQLLTELARRPDRIVSRSELYTAIWGRPYTREERSVDVYVKKLREKLAAAGPGWVFIHTHFGFGYRLAPEARNRVAAEDQGPPVSHVFHTRATDR